MLTIYHNPRCKTSRAGLAYLDGKTKDYAIREYLKNPLSKDEFKEILKKMNVQPQDLLRTQEELYKKELKGKEFNDEEWIRIILDHPRLLQRPIVMGKYRAVLAQPPEKMDVLL